MVRQFDESVEVFVMDFLGDHKVLDSVLESDGEISDEVSSTACCSHISVSVISIVATAPPCAAARSDSDILRVKTVLFTR